MGLEERGDEANQEEERSEYLESAKGRWRDGPEEDEPGWPQLHVKGPGMEVAKHDLLPPLFSWRGRRQQRWRRQGWPAKRSRKRVTLP
jgi:hypothetical protein